MRYKNNPLNIRYSETNHWIGQTAPRKGFCQFETVEYGVRAAYRLIQKYIRSGHSTIRDIVRRWAPPEENNTGAYIRFVAERTGIASNLRIMDWDHESLKRIVTAMAWYESHTVLLDADFMACRLYVR